MNDAEYAQKLQQILDEGNFFVIEKLQSLDREELQEYAQKCANNHEIAMRSHNDDAKVMAKDLMRTVEAYIQLQRIKKNMNSDEEDSGGVSLV